MIKLLINDVDLSEYVISSEREHCICNPIANLSLLLAPDLPVAINMYDSVVFYESGTKVFTGYAYDVVKARMEVEFALTCHDVLIRTKDTWLDEEVVSTGESIGARIEDFLRRSGITEIEVAPAVSRPIYPGHTWQYMSCFSAILETIKMGPYQVYANRDGKVILTELRKGTPVYTITDFTEYERTLSDGWIRNEVFIFGNDGIAAHDVRSNDHLRPAERRAIIIATGMISSLATAYSIIEEMLDEFENPLDTKSIIVEGNPDYEIGQTIRLVEPWSGYDEDCLITSEVATCDSSGYRVELTLDEKCPHFWGWDRKKEKYEYDTLYCGTWGLGVYKSNDNGQTWTKTNLGNKHVYAVHWGLEHPILTKGILWAACKEGVYKTINGGNTWSKMFLDNPLELIDSDGTITESDLYFPGVVTKHSDARKVYVLAGDYGDHGVWLYKSTNEGVSWTNVRIF